MRVAMILPSLANKGPVIVAQDLCRGLMALGHFCKVYYFDEIRELEMPCEVERISFWQKIDFDDYDIIHSHMYRPDAYVFYHKFARKFRTKFVTTMHQHLKEQLPYDGLNSLKLFLGIRSWLFFLRSFDAIVALNKHQENYYKKKNNLKQIFIIFNGRKIDTELSVDATDQKVLEEFKKKYKVLGAVAYITVRKGYEQLIEVLPFLPEYGILFIGDGPALEALQLLARQLKVSERCLWLGKRSNGYRYLKYADVFALCSRTEGFPLALIEAAAMAKPTVCSDIPALISVISRNDVVFFELGNIPAFVKAIKEAEVNRCQLSLSIRQYYEKYLLPEVMVENYVSLYQSLLKA